MITDLGEGYLDGEVSTRAEEFEEHGVEIPENEEESDGSETVP